MVIAEIITILNIILWLLPPIRQYSGKYFLYFLILAVSDPINILSLKFLNVDPFKTYFVMSLILLLIILNLNKRVSFIEIVVSVLTMVIVFYSNIKIFVVLISAIHIFIFFYFIVITIQYYYYEEKLILFHFALLFYEMSIVLKFIFLIIDVESGTLFFYSTSMLQILLALYFCWDVEAKPKIILLLKNPEN